MMFGMTLGRAVGVLLVVSAALPGLGGTAPAAGWPFADRPGNERLFDDAARIGLYNARVGVLFRKSDGALLGLWSETDGRCAVNVDDKGIVRTPLWALELLPAGGTNPCAARAESVTNFVWASSANSSGLELLGTARDVPCGALRGELTLRVSFAPDGAGLRWRLDARPADKDASVWAAEFPRLFVPAFDAAPAANRYLVPYRQGAVRIYGAGQPRGSSELPYPGPAAKFQCMAAYGADSGRGLYCAAEDGGGHSKVMTQLNEPARQGIVLGWRHLPADRAVPGTGFRMPYAVVTQPYRGDWWDACRIYRAWWTQQEWAGRGLLAERKDVPDWLTHTPIVVRLSTTKPARTVANNLRGALAFSDALGGRPFYGVWYGPFGDAAHPAGLGESGHGHKLPLQPGVADALAQLKARGIRVQAYQQSIIYQTNREEYRGERAAADGAVSRGLDGAPHYYGSAASGDYAMCRAAEWWQRRMADLAAHATRLGFAGVYLDSFGKGANDCLAGGHGHPRGGGNTVLEGQRRMAQRVRQEVRRLDGEAILAGEAPVEAFVDLLDVYLFAVNRYPGYVPATRVIWGDYGLGHGRSIRSAGDGPTVVAELATLFLEGAIPGRFFCEGGTNEILQPGHESDLAFLKKTVAYTQAGIDYLRFGEYLHPLALTPLPPMVAFTESSTNGKIEAPALLHSVLRSHRDGSVALVFANISDSPQPAAFTADPALRAGAAAARPEARLARLGTDGTRAELGRGAQPWTATLTVAPRDVALLVLE